MVDVPCNGCTACCRNDLLILHPELGDDAAQYETMPAVNPLTGGEVLVLKHKPGGGCVYLEAGGCSIHGRAPAICREFDCRRFYLRLVEGTTREERRKLMKGGLIGRDVLSAGRRRVSTLPSAAPPL